MALLLELTWTGALLRDPDLFDMGYCLDAPSTLLAGSHWQGGRRKRTWKGNFYKGTVYPTEVEREAEPAPPPPADGQWSKCYDRNGKLVEVWIPNK